MPALEIHPPSYPLDREAFRLALATGHGRAMIHAERHGVGEFRDVVLEACGRWVGYDAQVDGYREDWLARLCQMAGCVEEVILRGLPDGDSRARDQYVRLLKEFHLQGVPGTLEVLKELAGHPERDLANEACWVLSETAGEEELIFVAEILGQRFSTDEGYWDDGSIICRFDGERGAGRAMEILSAAAPENPDVARYLREVEKENAKVWKREPPAARSLEEIMAEIRSGESRRFRLASWGRTAGETERQSVAEILHDRGLPPAVLANALRFLSRQGLPEFDENLPALLSHSDGEVRFWASEVLSRHDNESIRPAALIALERGFVSEGVNALALTAREEDAGAILLALETHAWDDDRHALLGGILDLMEKGPRLQSRELALTVYELTPCMHCREKGLKLLLDWNACPGWVREEAACDAKDSIRGLIADGE